MLAATLFCLALNVYHEARGQPYLGQVAVALVTLNRSRESGKAVCKTVTEPAQFSWTSDYVEPLKAPFEVESRAWAQAWQASEDAMRRVERWDFTRGATYFHTVAVRPKWAKKLEPVGQYGQHIFYRRPPPEVVRHRAGLLIMALTGVSSAAPVK
jgi:N-acetylmuramoyl-L-alanine amidase